MNHLLPAWPLLLAFAIASLILAVTPGPGVFYIVTRSVLQGRRAGLASVAGVALGNIGNAIAAVLGLAALFAASSMAFVVVKYLGAAYLIYLGIQKLRARVEPGPQQVAPEPLAKVFRDGLIVALFNPKTTIFFAAFLPQFIAPGESPMVQGLALGVAFVLIAGCSDSLYALAASAMAPRLARGRPGGRIGRWLGGGVFIGLGVATALMGGRKA